MSSHTLWPACSAQDLWHLPGELEKPFSFYIFHGRKIGETDVGTAALVLSDRPSDPVLQPQESTRTHRGVVYGHSSSEG